MLLIVYRIKRPEGLNGTTCCHHDFLPTRVYGNKLGNVIDTALVGDPNAIFQGPMPCNFLLADDRKRGALLYSLHRKASGISFYQNSNKLMVMHRPIYSLLILKTPKSSLGCQKKKIYELSTFQILSATAAYYLNIKPCGLFYLTR